MVSFTTNASVAGVGARRAAQSFDDLSAAMHVHATNVPSPNGLFCTDSALNFLAHLILLTLNIIKIISTSIATYNEHELPVGVDEDTCERMHTPHSHPQRAN